MTEAMRAVYACPDRESVAAELDRLLSWLMHSNVPEMKRVAAMLCAERGGRPELVRAEGDQRDPRGPELRAPVDEEGREGLQEHRVLQERDLT